MARTCPILALVLAFPLVGTSASRADDVLTSLTSEKIRSILAGMGLEFTQADERTFRFELDGYKVFLFCSDTDCQLYSGFKDRCTVSRVNEWNRTKRFSRAYIDKEGDPCIEADIDIGPGVSRESIREFIKTFRLSVRTFALFIRN